MEYGDADFIDLRNCVNMHRIFTESFDRIGFNVCPIMTESLDQGRHIMVSLSIKDLRTVQSLGVIPHLDNINKIAPLVEQFKPRDFIILKIQVIHIPSNFVSENERVLEYYPTTQKACVPKWLITFRLQ
jgi:hypothetical protein